MEAAYIFPSDFTEGKSAITINGLIWMGDAAYMKEQIQEKLEKRLSLYQIKIGVDWKSEHVILQKLREKFSKEQLELRVDANGDSVKRKRLLFYNNLLIFIFIPLNSLSRLEIGMIWLKLCARTPTPIALDEELIGIIDPEKKETTFRKDKSSIYYSETCLSRRIFWFR